MKDARVLRIDLSSRALRRTIGAVAGLNMILLTGTFLGRSWADTHWRVRFLAGQLDLSRENNLASWYSSLLLLLVAAVMLLCFLLDRSAERSAGSAGLQRGVKFGWLVLSLVFAALSLDELGSLHERLDDLQWLALPVIQGLNAWTAMLAIPIGGVACGMVAFAWLRLRTVPAALVLMIGGVLLFLTVPVQEHIEAALRAASGLGRAWPRPPLHAVLEEGAEVYGSAMFLAAGLLYAHLRLRDTTRQAIVELRVRTLHTAGLGALLGTGLLCVHGLLPHLMQAEDGRGVPQQWFPMVMAAIAAALCVQLWRVEGRRTAGALLMIGLLALGLSLDHGSNFAWQQEWLASGRYLAGRMRAAFVVVLFGGLAWVFIARVPNAGARLAAAAWAMLLTFTLIAAHDAAASTMLTLTACTALLSGLVELLPAAAGDTAAVPHGDLQGARIRALPDMA